MTEPVPFPSLFELAECRHGRMLFPARDRYVGRSLAQYGEFSEGEVDLFRQVVRPGDTVLDVGANIGAHTVAFARLTGQAGRVLAFEPQPVLYRVLNANLTLNSLLTVEAFHTALGRHAGICHVPPLDYGDELNFGGLSLEGITEGHPVSVHPMDALSLDRCDFIKIDVEGAELSVLEGGIGILDRFRPLLYVENDRQDKSPDLIRFLLGLDYNLWWHLPPLFRSDNWKAEAENLFPGLVSINLIASPRERGLRFDAPPVLDPGDWYC